MVIALHFHCQGPGSNAGQGTTQAAWHGQKNPKTKKHRVSPGCSRGKSQSALAPAGFQGGSALHSQGQWQNMVACSCRNEVPVLPAGCSQLLEPILTSLPCDSRARKKLPLAESLFGAGISDLASAVSQRNLCF